MSLPEGDLNALAWAKKLLENPSFAAKLASAIGSPLERGMQLLPARWTSLVHSTTMRALYSALSMAVRSTDDLPFIAMTDRMYCITVATTGAIGGAFGLPSLLLELPLSTTLMLRNIADIAADQGEPIVQPESKLACLEVFALGGRRSSDDSVDAGYFAVRGALSRAVSQASRHIAERGLSRAGAPAIVNLLEKVGARFGVTITEKIAAQTLPLVGAATAAAVNVMFMRHFQDMARGHFIVRRLERIHGAERVRSVYESL